MPAANHQTMPRAVLFACLRNEVRSPMAAALMRHYFGSSVYVASAGLTHGEPDPFVIEVMGERGISLATHRPHTFDELGDTSFDLIIALADEARRHAAGLARTHALEIEYWPSLDPTQMEGTREQRLAAYRALRDVLDARIRARFGVSGPA
jgi:protein-tyrosine-phosphatase